MNKSKVKTYYDLSEVDDVYNNNQPQLILNTDHKDSNEKVEHKSERSVNDQKSNIVFRNRRKK